MTAPELRAFVRGVLDELDPDARTTIGDALVARAVKGRAGWSPHASSQRIVDDAKSFADAPSRRACSTRFAHGDAAPPFATAQENSQQALWTFD
jgi:hypothetical protein